MSWRRRSLSAPIPLAEFIEEQLLLAGYENISSERSAGSTVVRLTVFAREGEDLPDAGDLAGWLLQARQRGLAAAGLAWEDEALPDRDWNADFRARFVGKRLTERVEVLPPWEEGAISPRAERPIAEPGVPLVIVIEPGQAFGTGEHPSTRGCLEQLRPWARRRGGPYRCLDIGCGTGILAIAAKLWGAQVVEGFDVDPASIVNAYLNADLNGLRAAIRFRWGEPARLAPGGWDLILCNLFLMPILRLLPRMDAALAPGGGAILSGFLEQQAPQIAQAARGRHWRLRAERRLEGWVVQEWEKPQESW